MHWSWDLLELGTEALGSAAPGITGDQAGLGQESLGSAALGSARPGIHWPIQVSGTH